MRLGGRLSAAIDILADIETRRRPVADALKDWGLSHRFAGSGDRAAIGNIVYDALRKRLSHAFMMDDDGPSALAHAVLFRQWGLTPEELEREAEGDRFAPPPFAEEMLAAFAARDLATAPLYVQADVPEWTVSSFARSFGEEWLRQLQAMGERPPLDLRVNTLKAAPEKVLKALQRSGARPAPIAPLGIRIAPGHGPARLPNVTAEPSFAKGWFEVQDEGSQLVSALVAPQPGAQVLDFCAGGGGKTLAMAAAMENKGQIHAFDADRKRLAPIIERLKRAGTRNVQVHEDRTALEPLRERCDCVLVDAPCTGTGTWRRRPDTKWRLSPAGLEERLREQREVLHEAAAFVRPGGTLAYITCSLMAEENEEQILRFRESHGEFEFVPAANREGLFGEGKPQPLLSQSGTIMLTPFSTGTDGFFLAVLRRGG
jgi:16S rRNA (cytosine967-C5)-methyltransferase